MVELELVQALTRGTPLQHGVAVAVADALEQPPEPAAHPGGDEERCPKGMSTQVAAGDHRAAISGTTKSGNPYMFSCS